MFDNLNQPLIYLPFQLSYCDAFVTSRHNHPQHYCTIHTLPQTNTKYITNNHNIHDEMYTQSASEEKHLQAMVGVPDANYTDEGSKTMYGYGYANLTTAKIIAQVFTPT